MRIETTVKGDRFILDGFSLDTLFSVDTFLKIYDRWLAVVTDSELPPVLEEAVTLRILPFRIVEGPEGDFMLLLTTSQKAGLQIDARDAKGNPAQLDGAPTWDVSDSSVLTLTVASDGLSAEVVAVGQVGTAQVNVTADARIGPEVKTLAGTLDVQVVAGEAVTLGITAGTPVDQ